MQKGPLELLQDWIDFLAIELNSQGVSTMKDLLLVSIDHDDTDTGKFIYYFAERILDKINTINKRA